MITERTQYFAKAGLAEEVLQIRRKASAVRRQLGLPAGRILKRATASDAEAPDVVWDCTFADEAAQVADLAARAASPAFEAVRAEMRACLDRFERQVLVEDDDAMPNGLRRTFLGGHAIVPREVIFHSAGRELKGYLFVPPGKGPFPCLLCNHGSGIDQGTLDVSRPGTAALLMSWGIASLLPHRRGYGNSPGVPWREEVSAEPGTEAYDRQLLRRLDEESDDILAALDCVAALPDIDPRHIGVMGSSFGGVTTLFAAAKSATLTCAIEFAGAAMNWDHAPGLRAGMIEAAAKLAMPLFLIQAENDYSIRPTHELVAALDGHPTPVWSRIYPAFGINAMEGHLLESRGPLLWSEDVHRFLELYL